MNTVTPMMRQYLEIKGRYPDAILFFRLGDFYEMFMEDAITASRVLEITLTSRNKGASDEVPLCGIPYHSSQPYIAKLVESGFKVAVCEQVEDPKTAKGIVKREVVRVITPGLITDTESLHPKENNFLAAVAREEGGRWGIAVLDISTGEFRVTQTGDLDSARDEIVSLNPAEILYSEAEGEADFRRQFAGLLSGRMINPLPAWVFATDRAEGLLKDFFSCSSLEAFGCQELPAAIAAAGAILHYVGETQKGAVDHIRSLSTYATSEYMVLDEATRRNLELTGTLQGGRRTGSLLGVLDRTVTSMGGRRLRAWIGQPLVDVDRIRCRHQAVAELKEQSLVREELRCALDGVHDLERLNGKIAMGTANGRDLAALGNSLRRLPALLTQLSALESPLLEDLLARIDPLEDMVGEIDRALVDDPPFGLREGGLLRDGFDPELDRLRCISREGKGWIARLEREERERTGISSLKVRFNKVFGYYIEITKAHLSRIPADYQRKQTLANAERFVTPALREYEETVLGAEARVVEIEYELFQQLRECIARQGRRIHQTADGLAELDVLIALADLAHDRQYVVPEIDEGSGLTIVEGRHPVIEEMSKSEPFVPNDVAMDTRDNQILIITGPNMAGKSTFMRQVALITLMAQMGSLVPARSARIGIVDRIFTRVGASDNLARGHSTFMVEMIETANILRQASSRSLIVLDEIGRGTSTFDGISIAWAVAEYLHDHAAVAAKTLFATHFHELTELALTRERVKNFNIAVKEWNDQIIFLRKIVPGGASHSYGIQVARLAGLPGEVIERAREILKNLEAGEFESEGEPRLARGKKEVTRRDAGGQLSLFDPAPDLLKRRLDELDISALTPLQALNILDDLKRVAQR